MSNNLTIEQNAARDAVAVTAALFKGDVESAGILLSCYERDPVAGVTATASDQTDSAPVCGRTWYGHEDDHVPAPDDFQSRAGTTVQQQSEALQRGAQRTRRPTLATLDPPRRWLPPILRSVENHNHLPWGLRS